MECSITINNQEMCKLLEVNSHQLFEVGVELDSEHPQAASFLFDIISYINRSRQLSSKTIRQKLLSCSRPDYQEPLLFIDEELFEQLIDELTKLGDELYVENKMAADILHNTISYLRGDGSFSVEIIKHQLIYFSLSENILQLSERHKSMK
jgi:hypothetical protein